ncbi:hypothetical protein M433DRAFT_161347 [Acidomyces richmondensis BFW]|nr:hypothetical protein M433DRAFT_161347 [Acidomyces richmondensis BFW]
MVMLSFHLLAADMLYVLRVRLLDVLLYVLLYVFAAFPMLSRRDTRGQHAPICIDTLDSLDSLDSPDAPDTLDALDALGPLGSLWHARTCDNRLCPPLTCPDRLLHA